MSIKDKLNISRLKKQGDIPGLIKALGSDNPDMSESAFSFLEKEKKNPAVVLGLKKALKNENWRIREASARLLGKIGQEPGVVDALYEALNDSGWRVRLACLKALKDIGILEKAWIERIFLLLKDEYEQVQEEAKLLIRKSVPPDVFVDSFKDVQDEQIKRLLVEILSDIPADSNTVSLLVAKLEDEDAQIRTISAGGLKKISPAFKEKILPAFTKALRDKHPGVKKQAALGIMKMGPSAGEAVAGLIDNLKDRSFGSRKSALEALRKIRPSAGEALTAMIDVLSDGREEDRALAADIIGNMEETATGAVGSLIEGLDDSSELVRKRVASSLCRVTGQDFGDDKEKWLNWWKSTKENNTGKGD